MSGGEKGRRTNLPGRAVNCKSQRKKMRPQGFCPEKKWRLALVPANWAKEWGEKSRGKGNAEANVDKDSCLLPGGEDAFGSRLQVSWNMRDWSSCGKMLSALLATLTTVCSSITEPTV